MSAASERPCFIWKWSNWHAERYQIPQNQKLVPNEIEKQHENS